MSQSQRSPDSLSRAADGGGAPTAIEYAIIAVLIAAVAVGTWKTFGEPPAMENPGTTAAP
jgi:hypothetical protein